MESSSTKQKRDFSPIICDGCQKVCRLEISAREGSNVVSYWSMFKQSDSKWLCAACLVQKSNPTSPSTLTSADFQSTSTSSTVHSSCPKYLTAKTIGVIPRPGHPIRIQPVHSQSTQTENAQTDAITHQVRKASPKQPTKTIILTRPGHPIRIQPAQSQSTHTENAQVPRISERSSVCETPSCSKMTRSTLVEVHRSSRTFVIESSSDQVMPCSSQALISSITDRARKTT